MGNNLHREYGQEIEMSVGLPVYYLDPEVEEMRLGHVARIQDGYAVVIRDGLRERVPVDCMKVAKRRYKEERHGNAG